MRKGPKVCEKHGGAYGPCSCAMGRLPRLVEPTVLLLLADGEAKHGYHLFEQANEIVVTDGEIDTGIVYRTLRTLEANEMVISEWAPGSKGPSRRLYRLTQKGRDHIADWSIVLGRLSERMGGLAGDLQAAASEQT